VKDPQWLNFCCRRWVNGSSIQPKIYARWAKRLWGRKMLHFRARLFCRLVPLVPGRSGACSCHCSSEIDAMMSVLSPLNRASSTPNCQRSVSLNTLHTLHRHQFRDATPKETRLRRGQIAPAGRFSRPVLFVYLRTSLCQIATWRKSAGPRRVAWSHYRRASSSEATGKRRRLIIDKAFPVAVKSQPFAGCVPSSELCGKSLVAGERRTGDLGKNRTVSSIECPSAIALCHCLHFVAFQR